MSSHAASSANRLEGKGMSSLRVDTLRLCWLETFVAVAEEENISAAARELGIDQSTVSRYIQALENWLGEPLIEPGKVHDPDDARVSIAITEFGRGVRDAAAAIVDQLDQLRTPAAKARALISEMNMNVAKMEDGLRRGLKIASAARARIEEQRRIVGELDGNTPLPVIESAARFSRTFFCNYERQRKLASKSKARKPSPFVGEIPAPPSPADDMDQQPGD
jgi:DNA-binding MarR family transcriptional regulator